MSGICNHNIKIVRLGDVVSYQKGKKPKRSSKIKIDNFEVPYINIKAFEYGIFDDYTDGAGCVICQDGDLLMVWDGARCGLVGKARNGAVGSTLMKIEPKDNLEREFLYYFLLSKYRTLNSKPKGVGIPHVEPYLLWNFKLSLPPLPEQHRIVARIEELFSELDNGRQQLLTAQKLLKVYRQSLLKAAFEGKLTAEWLKQHYTQTQKTYSVVAAEPEGEYRINGELPKGWKWKELRDFILRIEAGKSFKCEERPPSIDEIGVLKVSAVTWQHYNENESKTIIEESRIIPEYFVKQGDFLFSRANTIDLVGAVVLVNAVTKKLMLSDKTLRIVFTEKVLKEFVLYYLRCRTGRNEIERLSTGNQMSMRNIGQERIKQIMIPFTATAEQEQIVLELESRLTVCDKLEETIADGLQQSETLRQSILKRAFEGRLV